MNSQGKISDYSIKTINNLINEGDRIVSFGDAINDLPMFAISDQCYAMANAVTSLKQQATAVIKSNDEDGVAHWLKEHVINTK